MGLSAEASSAAISRTKAFFIWLAAIIWGGTATWMIATPEGWWAAVPGVGNTGPYNAHFVRDVGCTYMALAVCLAAGLLRPRWLYPMVLVPAIWMALHASLHLWDVASSRLPLEHLLLDAPGVFLPVVLHWLLARWVKPDWEQALRN